MMAAKLRDRIVGIALEVGVPLPPERKAARFEISDDERVLRRETSIEADLGDIGLFDDRLDADGADALAIEQIGADLGDPLPRRLCSPLPLRRSGTRIAIAIVVALALAPRRPRRSDTLPIGS